jgi:hypothetical protein
MSIRELLLQGRRYGVVSELLGIGQQRSSGLALVPARQLWFVTLSAHGLVTARVLPAEFRVRWVAGKPRPRGHSGPNSADLSLT